MKTLNAAIFTLVLVSISLKVDAQGISRAHSKDYDAYYDSLKTTDYPYTFPLLGKKAYKKGFNLPYAWGISGIYYFQKQDINITQTSIGINGGDLVNVSDLIEFGPTIATTNAYTVRPDLWVLPFLNVYGIFGVGTTSTEVNLLKPVGFETTQTFNVSSYGFGATLAGAVGPIWMAWDNNYNFANIDVVVQPVRAYNSSFRVGHTLMHPSKPEQTLAVWVGVFYQAIQNDTQGVIGVKDIFPDIGDGSVIEDLQQWAEDLPPAQKIITNELINRLEEASSDSNIDEATIEYKLDKKVAAPFNMILGAQFQFDKHWILRTEFGVLGERSQLLLNLNYRFGGFKGWKKGSKI